MEKQRKRMSETASEVSMSEKLSLSAGFRSTMMDMSVPTMPSTEMMESSRPSTTKSKVASPPGHEDGDGTDKLSLVGVELVADSGTKDAN